MQRRYVRLFDAIKTKLLVTIDFYKCDYEAAQHNGFKTVFPESELTGCYFHFNKAVWKKGKELNVTATREGQVVRLTANLPLLPTINISDAWINILQSVTDTDEMKKFHTYVNKQWMSLMAMISCANEVHRTTNSLEAWHRRLKSRISPKPSFIFLLEKVMQESRIQDIQLTKNIFNFYNKKRADQSFNAK